MITHRIGNPAIFGLATFGFSLALLGYQHVGHDQTAGAAVFALLVGAIGESIAGVLSLIRGDTYLGSVFTTFGVWLLGYFFYVTSDPARHYVTPTGVGVYVLTLIVPVLYFAIPAVRHRNVVLLAAFGALTALLLLLGLGAYDANTDLVKAGGWAALAAALIVFVMSAQDLLDADRDAIAARRDAASFDPNTAPDRELSLSN